MIAASQQELVYFRHFCIKNITSSPAFLALLLKKLTREDCRLAIFSYKLNINVSQDHVWIEQV